MSFRNILAIATFAIAAASGSHANDFYETSRSGFYLSGGLGLHNTDLEVTIDQVGSASETNLGLLTSIKIGGYINPSFALYYVRDAAWWTDEDIDDALVITGIGGIGGSYYFSSYLGGYLEFGLGLGDLTISDNADTATETGTAFMIGGGYEVTPNMQIGANLISTAIDDSTFSDVSYSSFIIAGKVEFKL